LDKFQILIIDGQIIESPLSEFTEFSLVILSDMLQHEESIRMSVSTTYQAEEVLFMLWKDAIISHTFVLVMRLEVFDLQKSEASPTLSRVISTSDGQEDFWLGSFGILEFLPASKTWPRIPFIRDSAYRAQAGPGRPTGRTFG
jgi:hypothetical protein